MKDWCADIDIDGDQNKFSVSSNEVSYSLSGYLANQTLHQMQIKDILVHNKLKAELLEMKTQLESQLSNEHKVKPSKTDRCLMRRLWVLEGALNENLSIQLLESVAIKHKKIDTVPRDFFYPELYQH